MGLNCNSFLFRLKEYKDGGIKNALSDVLGHGRNTEITDEEELGLSMLYARNLQISDALLKYGPSSADSIH